MTSANRLRTSALALAFALGMGAALPSHAFLALRLLSHAANSQHNTAALHELQSYCKNRPAATWQPSHAELCTNVPRQR